MPREDIVVVPPSDLPEDYHGLFKKMVAKLHDPPFLRNFRLKLGLPPGPADHEIADNFGGSIDDLDLASLVEYLESSFPAAALPRCFSGAGPRVFARDFDFCHWGAFLRADVYPPSDDSILMARALSKFFFGEGWGFRNPQPNVEHEGAGAGADDVEIRELEQDLFRVPERHCVEGNREMIKQRRITVVECGCGTGLVSAALLRQFLLCKARSMMMIPSPDGDIISPDLRFFVTDLNPSAVAVATTVARDHVLSKLSRMVEPEERNGVGEQDRERSLAVAYESELSAEAKLRERERRKKTALQKAQEKTASNPMERRALEIAFATKEQESTGGRPRAPDHVRYSDQVDTFKAIPEEAVEEFSSAGAEEEEEEAPRPDADHALKGRRVVGGADFSTDPVGEPRVRCRALLRQLLSSIKFEGVVDDSEFSFLTTWRGAGFRRRGRDDRGVLFDADVVFFNPPYVVTGSDEIVRAHQDQPAATDLQTGDLEDQRPMNVGSPSADDQLDRVQHVLSAAWAGGENGREVMDDFLVKARLAMRPPAQEDKSGAASSSCVHHCPLYKHFCAEVRRRSGPGVVAQAEEVIQGDVGPTSARGVVFVCGVEENDPEDVLRFARRKCGLVGKLLERNVLRGEEALWVAVLHPVWTTDAEYSLGEEREWDSFRILEGIICGKIREER